MQQITSLYYKLKNNVLSEAFANNLSKLLAIMKHYNLFCGRVIVNDFQKLATNNQTYICEMFVDPEHKARCGYVIYRPENMSSTDTKIIGLITITNGSKLNSSIKNALVSSKMPMAINKKYKNKCTFGNITIFGKIETDKNFEKQIEETIKKYRRTI